MEIKNYFMLVAFFIIYIHDTIIYMISQEFSLREKYPNTESFSGPYFPLRVSSVNVTKKLHFLCSVIPLFLGVDLKHDSLSPCRNHETLCSNLYQKETMLKTAFFKANVFGKLLFEKEFF